MRKTFRFVMVVCLMFAVCLTAGCGSSSNTSSACASAHGHHKIKVGLKSAAVYASGKHWIYTPLKHGAFKKGAPGRKKAFVKAGATLVLDAVLLNSVRKDVKDDKQLCHIYTPFTKAAAVLGTVGAKLKSGKGTEQDINDAGGTISKLHSEVK